jgi:hypothetical protein
VYPLHILVNHLEHQERLARELRNDRIAHQLHASRVTSTPAPARRRRARLVARLAR